MHLSMRADAQLVQAPGRLPILFELPAKLCEFYTAFAHRVAAFYQYDETLTPDMERAYLIVPRLSTRVSTSVVFQLGYPPQNRLIFCDLPTSMVFLISHTMVILAHEVAHFSGQATCLRGLRLERYAMCIAALIVRNFDIRNVFGLESQLEKIAITNISQYLKKEALNIIQKKYRNQKDPMKASLLEKDGYQTEQYIVLGEAVETLLKEPYTTLLKLIQKARGTHEAEDQQRIEFCAKKFLQLNSGDDNVDDWLLILRDLIFEVYADCAAIFTLKLEPQEFYSAIAYTEPLVSDQDVKQAFSRRQFSLRMILVNEVFYKDHRAKSNSNEALDVLMLYSKGLQDLPPFASIVFNHVMEYIKDCLAKMQNKMHEDGISQRREYLAALYKDVARHPTVETMQIQFANLLSDHWQMVREKANTPEV